MKVGCPLAVSRREDTLTRSGNMWHDVDSEAGGAEGLETVMKIFVRYMARGSHHGYAAALWQKTLRHLERQYSVLRKYSLTELTLVNQPRAVYIFFHDAARHYLLKRLSKRRDSERSLNDCRGTSFEQRSL